MLLIKMINKDQKRAGENADKFFFLRGGAMEGPLFPLALKL